MSSSMVPKLKVSWMVFLLGIVVLTGFGCADGEKTVGNASPVEEPTPSPTASVASDAATTQNTTVVSPKPPAAETLNCALGNTTNNTIVNCNGFLGTTKTFSCINTAGTRGLMNCTSTKTTTTAIHCTSSSTIKDAGISCNIITGITQCATGATVCPTLPDPMETFQCANITGAPAGSMNCTSMNSTGTTVTCTSDKANATILSCTSCNETGTASCPRDNGNSQTFTCLSKTGSRECTSITDTDRTIYCADTKGPLKCAEDFETAKAWTSAASGVHASISLVFVVMAFLAGRD